MKLSDAIGLGRMLVIAKPVLLLSKNGDGCALGMAGVGAGILKTGDIPLMQEEGYCSVYEYWPWLEQSFRKPCDCEWMNQFVDAAAIIMHLFDTHIFLLEDWTLDELIEWIASIEPAEEEAPVAEPTLEPVEMGAKSR